MLQKKFFWVAQQVGLSLFWLVAIGFLVAGSGATIFLWIAAAVLVAHLLEIPIAFHFLKGRPKSAVRVCLMTLLYGYTWWMPARRGLFSTI
jgi:hypothetical protein